MANNPTQDRWKTKADVLTYLVAQGWDIEKSTFYNHSNPAHKDGGRLNKLKGWYLKTHVDAYARQYLTKLDGADPDAGELGGLQREKLQDEILHRRIKMEKDQLDLDVQRGKYLPLDQFDLEMAGRAGVINSSFEHLIQSRIQEMVALVSGDQQKAQELVSYLKEKWGEMLAEYASTKEFQVIVKPQAQMERNT